MIKNLSFSPILRHILALIPKGIRLDATRPLAVHFVEKISKIFSASTTSFIDWNKNPAFLSHKTILE